MTKLTKLLLIDTSGQKLGLALTGGGPTIVHDEPVTRGHAEILFDRIAALLGRAGHAYDALDGIAVTVGPGSFTGLRIGIAAARGLGLALDLPVIGLPNLLALSLGGAQNTPLRVIADARRGMAYVQDFDRPGVPATGPRLVDAEAVLEGIGDRRPYEEGVIDLARLAEFARHCAPRDFLPEPLYVRPADAKPQTKGRIARAGEAGP